MTRCTDLGMTDQTRCASMGSTWCSCCKAKVPVEDTFPGRIMGCGPFCSKCRPFWARALWSSFGGACKHDGTASSLMAT